MYDFNLTGKELSDFYSDMAEEASFPTDEEMEEMARYYGEEK